MVDPSGKEFHTAPAQGGRKRRKMKETSAHRNLRKKRQTDRLLARVADASYRLATHHGSMSTKVLDSLLLSMSAPGAMLVPWPSALIPPKQHPSTTATNLTHENVDPDGPKDLLPFLDVQSQASCCAAQDVIFPPEICGDGLCSVRSYAAFVLDIELTDIPGCDLDDDADITDLTDLLVAKFIDVDETCDGDGFSDHQYKMMTLVSLLDAISSFRHGQDDIAHVKACHDKADLCLPCLENLGYLTARGLHEVIKSSS